MSWREASGVRKRAG